MWNFRVKKYYFFFSFFSLLPKYDGNDQLRQKAESLLHDLISSHCLWLKRIAYRLVAEKMGYFFGSLLDGTSISSRSRRLPIGYTNLFGLPLNAEIIGEIICSGLSSSDIQVLSNAENILTLILRSRNFLPQFGKEINRYLNEIAPLLLCNATKQTTLGHLILELHDPDNEHKFDALQMLRSNVILLFSHSSDIREEAIFRLLYTLQTFSSTENYIPRVDCMNDSIPNNLCIVEAVECPKWCEFSDLYESSYIEPMLKLLRSSGTDSSIRHTTLVQLSVMLQDPKMAKRFYDENAIDDILRIFDDSLRVQATSVDAENVIPIVNILSKLCMQFGDIRIALAADEHLIGLLLRSMFLFHHRPVFKSDCTIALFALAFADFIVSDNNDRLTIPLICKRLYVPIRCDFRRNLNNDKLINGFDFLVETGERSFDDNDDHVKMLYWRFVRISFAHIWFDSIDAICDIANAERKFADKSSVILTYQRANGETVLLNERLRLTGNDVHFIKTTSPTRGIKHWLKLLRNSTTSEQVIMSCAAIENFSNIDSTNCCNWNYELMFNAISRFTIVYPQSNVDAMIFSRIENLLRALIEQNFNEILIWMLRQFQQKKCVFIQLLKIEIDRELFAANIRLIEATLNGVRNLQSTKSIEQLLGASGDGHRKRENLPKRNLFDVLFDRVVSLMDEVFKERNLGK